MANVSVSLTSGPRPIILLNAIALALLTMPNIDGDARSSLIRFDQIALWVFFAELIARMISYGRKPWMFFKTGWNVFDFIIIGLSPLFAGQTLLLRLLRIFRLIRIFRFLPEVRILTRSITRSLPPLMSMSVLIFLALFIYGMAGVYLFSEEMPDQWGDITAALTSLFILLTLEEFANYLVDGLEVSPWALSADGQITPEEVEQLKSKIVVLERELKRLKSDG